jgi:hypothetical protein
VLGRVPGARGDVIRAGDLVVLASHAGSRLSVETEDGQGLTLGAEDVCLVLASRPNFIGPSTGVLLLSSHGMTGWFISDFLRVVND